LTDDILSLMDVDGMFGIVTLSKSQIEVYSSTLHLQATLSWFSYFVHYWPISFFLVSIPFLYGISCTVLSFIVGIIYLYIYSRSARKTPAQQQPQQQQQFWQASWAAGVKETNQEKAADNTEAAVSPVYSKKAKYAAKNTTTYYDTTPTERHIEDSDSVVEDEEQTLHNRFLEEPDLQETDWNEVTRNIVSPFSSRSMVKENVDYLADNTSSSSSPDITPRSPSAAADLQDWVAISDDRNDDNDHSPTLRRRTLLPRSLL